MPDTIVMSPTGEVNGGFEVGDEMPVENNLSTATRPSRAKGEQAVCVRSAYKHYGTSKHPNRVLQNLHMTVPKGSM